MKFQSSDSLREYIKKIADLELSAYTQQRAIDESENRISANKGPEKPILYKPVVPIKKVAPNPPKFPFSCILLTVIGLALLYGFFAVISTTIIAALIYAIGIIPLIISIRAYKKYFKEKAQYNEECNNCLRMNEEQKRRYDQKVIEYNEKQKVLEKEYKENLSEFAAAKEKAIETVNQLKESLLGTEDVIKKLYDLDVVFPKYRNLVAMCTFYEYLACGRCEALEGPNGAYNIYEAEQRQNLIIGKLDEISNKLDKVIDNQYYLCSEIKKANQSIDKISNEVEQILLYSFTAAKSSAITAECAQITAQNTEALKYLAIIS